ncbi:MAG: DUF2499 domain-containing protein, partial [Nostoc sp.]
MVAIWLIWTYGELTNNRNWWGLSLAMLPPFTSCELTYDQAITAGAVSIHS